ncbi:MAG: hypothetical protein FWD26_04580 [Treponema sp.]|nr:hypothetical protein [Treponema sp.]
MKKLLLALCCVFLFSACSEIISPDSVSGNTLPPGQFVIGIDRIVLSNNELGTVPGRNPSLNWNIIPINATQNELRWRLDDVDGIDAADVASINESTGAITVRTDSVSEAISTLIRVESVADPSKYDTCLLTVYPVYPGERTWTWPTNPGVAGDLDQGDGGTLLFGTGNCDGYTPGLIGAGVYLINPVSPYEYGVGTPDGRVRGAGTYTTSQTPYNGGGRFLFPASPSYPAHIRTSGSGARVMRIAALYPPFTIIVNYQSNDPAERWADIRIGDKEGLRIQGQASTNDNPTGSRTVWYSYDPSDPGKPEFGMEEFVPLAFVEANQGIRLYAVFVREGVYELNAAGTLLVPKN